jgi:hypothetical protein
MTICNAWWRVLRRTLAVIAGCGALASLACCGKPAPPPYVHLTSTSFAPDKSISAGQVLHTRAKFSGPITSSRISVYLAWDSGGKTPRLMRMHDDGMHGDTAANDGEYALDLHWERAYARGDSVKVRVAVYDQYYGIQNESSGWTTLAVTHKLSGRASSSKPEGPR